MTLQFSKVVRVVFVLLLVALVPLREMLKSQKRKLVRLESGLQEMSQNTALLQKDIVGIRRSLGAALQRLEMNTVSLEEPILWCLDHVRDQLGESGVEIQYVGVKALVEMNMDRSVRDRMDGRVACLVPYAVRLVFEEISLARLRYVLEQIESPRASSVVNQLQIEPSGERDLFSVTILVWFPQFLYAEDLRDIEEFLRVR